MSQRELNIVEQSHGEVSESTGAPWQQRPGLIPPPGVFWKQCGLPCSIEHVTAPLLNWPADFGFVEKIVPNKNKIIKLRSQLFAKCYIVSTCIRIKARL